jgi:hypothetical protein
VPIDAFAKQNRRLFEMKEKLKMHDKGLDFESLAYAARRGDSDAGAKLRQELEPQLMIMVRSALRHGAGGDMVAQLLLKDAQRHAPNRGFAGHEAPEQLIAHVARKMAESVRTSLTCPTHPRQWLVETVTGI